MNTNRIITSMTVCTLMASCSSPKNEQPNVILIMADDMGYECLGVNGAADYKTPVLDNLARTGANFTQCISQPLCTPSRVKIMTGMYNFRNYETFEYLNPETFSFGKLMKEAGYKTAIAGKWQLNGYIFNHAGGQDINRPYEHGFDEFCLWQVNKNKREGERYADPLIVKNGSEIAGLDDSYGPDVFADFVLDFIDRHEDEKFFIYYPMVLVHDPFVPTPDDREWENPENRYDGDTAYFKSMMSYTDKIVGRITRHLKEKDLFDNTLLIFTGDNGTHTRIFTRVDSGYYQGGKGSMTDAGTRVPLVVSWPDGMEGSFTYDGLVEFSDFFATLNDLAGLEHTSDGKSLLPLLKGETESHRERVFVHYEPGWGNFPNGRFIRNLEYKLYHDGRFYHISGDPLEQNPLDTTNLSPQLLTLKRNLEMELKEFPPPGFE